MNQSLPQPFRPWGSTHRNHPWSPFAILWTPKEAIRGTNISFHWGDSITVAQIAPLRSLIRLILTLCHCYSDHAYSRADGEGPCGAHTRSHRVHLERIRHPYMYMWKLYHLSRSPAQPGHVPYDNTSRLFIQYLQAWTIGG